MKKKKVVYFEGCASVYDGFNKDAQICMVFFGPVSFDADAQTSRTRVTERDLEGQKLSGPVGGQDQLVLLCFLQQKNKQTNKKLRETLHFLKKCCMNAESCRNQAEKVEYQTS